MSSAGLSGIDRYTLFQFETTNTVRGRDDLGHASESVMDSAKFVRVKPGEGFGKAADTQRMPHPRGSTES
jgi:hypothetical protein